MVTHVDPKTMRDERNARAHAERIQGMLNEVVRHVREDVGKVDDPKAEALFETNAEVLTGLVAAYEHFARRSEEAWR